MSNRLSNHVLPSAIADQLDQLDRAALRAEFLSADEFVTLPDWLTPDELTPLVAALPQLEPHVHRNYIPGHKKGGSISRYDLDRYAPAFRDFYQSPRLHIFLEQLCGRKLLYCPPDDPHAYALYYYNEAGDHVGYHYDTSYYRGVRYTVLIGLVDRSSCRLEYELFRTRIDRVPVRGSVALDPGTMLVFNGDNLWHRVTPARAGEQRIALTLEFVTDHAMNPVRRFVSNMKDAIAYFGFRQVFGGPKRN